jgi:hypothetical protein
MQGRIMLEYQLNTNLRIDTHGVYIMEQQLAENRLSQEEKEQIVNSGGLMPWIAGKHSVHQIEFLVREFGSTSESVQNGIANGGGSYLSSCAKIAHEENFYERTGDARFNPARRAMARMFLEVYGYTEAGWTDSYAD